MRLLFLVLLLLVGVRSPAADGPRTAPEIRSGDRIVLVGDTLIERESTYSHVESALTRLFADRRITFRNLGWSADTPEGRSRASFDWSKARTDWFRLLTNQIAAAEPSLVILGYGMANSLEAEPDPDAFGRSLSALIDAVRTHSAAAPPRFVLLSPIGHEAAASPLADRTAHQAMLARFAAVIEEVAGSKGAGYLSLLDLTAAPSAGGTGRTPLTDNGIVLNDAGYRALGRRIAAYFGRPEQDWTLKMNPASGAVNAQGLLVAGAPENAGGVVRLTATAGALPSLPRAGDPAGEGLIQVEGLSPGTYELRVNGVAAASGSQREWAEGLQVALPGAREQSTELVEAIRLKNTQFFYRWRPQNQTYLFGFRRHEQGQNAAEIPKFDPLIAEQEARIESLKQPKERKLEWVRMSADTPPAVRPVAAPRPPAREPAVASVQPQPTPDFEVAPGLEVRLFAENPQLAKPIQINFDPEGRLWVASSAVYPQIMPGQIANDKILVLEDRDGDGLAETSRVFADGLLIPTGVEPGDGGVYVGQSTELLHFRDTDGDGRADERRVVLGSFGTEDTHHILHTLRWGYDGRLAFNQSIYIHTHVETPHGVVRLNSGGVFQFRPSTWELEVFLRGFCNPWGHDYDRFGQSFVTDGAGFQGVSWGVPGAMYFTYAGGRRLMDSISPGNYPKFCGLEILDSPAFPEEYQGNFITCDFRAHRIVRFGREAQGAGYVTRELPDVLRSTNVTFRPIDVKLGPDGALYVADWSNPIIQHGEVDFRDPRRDHDHGRIWRISVKGQGPVPKRDLRGMEAGALFDLTVRGDGPTRKHARRVLAERGPDVLAALRARPTSTDEVTLLELLWLHQAVDRPEPGLLARVLAATDPRVRGAATRVLAAWSRRLPQAAESLARGLGDPNPQVQVEAVRGLARIPDVRSAEKVLELVDRPMDRFLEYAVWLGINDLAPQWLAALESGRWSPDGREKQLAYALQAIDPAVSRTALGRLLQDRGLPRDGQGPVVMLLAQAGAPAELRRLFEQLVQGGFDAGGVARALETLNQAARLRRARPDGDLGAVGPFLESTSIEARVAAFRLAGAWKHGPAVPRLLASAANAEATAQEREAALTSLGEIGGAEGIAGLKQLLAGGPRADVLRQATLVLAPLDADAAAVHAVAVLRQPGSEEEALGFWRAWLNVRGAGAVLARALPTEGLPAASSRSGLRALREGNRKEPELALALGRASGDIAAEQELTATQLQELAVRVMREGDPLRGEAIYRKSELACITCHAIGGAGGKVGPDMTSIGASAPADYLIESLLFPNRKIKEGYHSVVVETDAQEFSGILLSESPTELVIRNATDQEVSVPKATITKRATGASLMPTGLLDGLTPQERIDLYRFLAELGKPGPFDASRGSVARAWRLRAGTHTIEQFGEARVMTGEFNDKEWNRSYTRVNGVLPVEDLQQTTRSLGYTSIIGIYAATEFEASRAGVARFLLQIPPNTPGWFDGKLVALQPEWRVDLTPGRHRLVLKLDARNLPPELRVESPDVSFLTP